MKGCLSFIFKIITLVLVFLGLVHIGAIDFLYNKFINQSQETIINETNDFIDLSQISNEYKINKKFDIGKNKIVFSEHNATKQKMLMIKPYSNTILTEEDIKSDNLQEKIEDFASKIKVVKFDKISITKKGNIQNEKQNIPYAKFTAEISNIPIKDIEGIVGVSKNKNNENIIIISTNEKDKYSQIISEAFYKQVK